MNKRILLIDDHQTVFRLLEAIVRIKGYTLLYAENGQQGIVMARKEQPDLIVLDIMMPDLDGFKVCQFLKENDETKHIPVMFLTARGAEDDLENGRKAGAEGFMTKPFQTIDVLKQIEGLLKK
ncbi:MAG: response regulator [Desulfuromonadales bacterium]|nr:response regulator [Desulfuromonadales bacterium]